MPQDPGQRLQKALAHLGLGSRREVEAWIRAGRLTVNGTAAELGTRVHESDRIRLDGRLVRQRPAAAQQVFLCHRSPGEAPEALFERLPRSGGRRFIGVSPLPQHDGGLELATSDGEIAERLQRAVRRLEIEFSVRLRGELGEAQLASVLAGELDSGERLEVTDCAAQGGEGANRWYTLTARGASGKDVRQLFERSGGMVSRVLRVRLGSVVLERALSRGRFRKLTPAELQRLIGEPAGHIEGAERTQRGNSPERPRQSQQPRQPRQPQQLRQARPAHQTPRPAQPHRRRPTARRSSGR